MIVVGLIGFATILMVANTMFSVFYSVSNLGALNIGSAITVFLLDQIVFRTLLGVAVYLSARITLFVLNRSHADHSVSNQLQIF